MAERPTAGVEREIGKHPSLLVKSEEATFQKAENLGHDDFINSKEDFLDSQHPLYGTVDEFGRKLPGWTECLTARALLLSAGIGFVFNLMVLKLGLVVGVIPSLNLAASLLGFAGIKAFVSAASYLNIRGLSKPFTRQENTVIQTTVVSCYGLAFSGGFTQSLLGMGWNAYLQSEGGTIQYPDGNVPESAYGHPPSPLPKNVIQPSIGKYIGFMALIYFLGVVILVPLRRLFVLRYRLTFPSGTATGTIINGFHTPLGEELAKKQVKQLCKWFSLSFIYSFLKWIFSGPNDSCSLDNIPSFGFRAKYWTWYTDFSQTYIGIGLLVPKHISYGIMCGAVLTYGIMWPVINDTRAGEWFPEKYKQPSKNIRGLYGYKVFIGIGLLLGDGVYMIVKLAILTIWDAYNRRRAPERLTDDEVAFQAMNPEQRQERRLRNLRDYIFVNGQLPDRVALALYVCLVAISMGVTPQLFPGVKAQYILVAYILAPVFCFTNAYGYGRSDWNLLKIYGQLAVFIFAAWGGNNGGIIAGLAIATCIQTVVGSSGDLCQDFKTGYLTLSSPKSMFAAQVVGCALAVFISPAAFWLYNTGYNLGDPDGEYKAPFAPVWRNIAVVAVNGSRDLPKYCLALAGAMFGAAVVLNIIRDILARRFGQNSAWVKIVPIPSMLGIPSFVGAFFTVDMAIGSVILAIWQYFAPADAFQSAPIVASALIAGDGVWSVPSAILALAKVNPPICAQFFRTNYYTNNIASLVESD